MYVSVSVCPSPRLLITSGVMWHNMSPICLVEKVLQVLYDSCSCMVSSVGVHVVLALMRIIETNLYNKGKQAVTFTLQSF